MKSNKEQKFTKVILSIVFLILLIFYSGNFILTNTLGIYSLEWDLKAYRHVTKSGAVYLAKKSEDNPFTSNFSARLIEQENGLKQWRVEYQLDNGMESWRDTNQFILVDYYTGILSHKREFKFLNEKGK